MVEVIVLAVLLFSIGSLLSAIIQGIKASRESKRTEKAVLIIFLANNTYSMGLRETSKIINLRGSDSDYTKTHERFTNKLKAKIHRKIY